MGIRAIGLRRGHTTGAALEAARTEPLTRTYPMLSPKCLEQPGPSPRAVTQP